MKDLRDRTFVDPNEENLVARVSVKKKQAYGPTSLLFRQRLRADTAKLRRASKGRPRIIAVDCGMKENIMRSFVARGATVVRVPWDYDFTKEEYDGLFISNGPGDPTRCTKTIEHIKKAMADEKPILGICLGNQLLALAAGASTYKLKYGHRSQNQPCVEADSKRCYITSQNHGYAVDGKTLPPGWEEWFTNANDGSNEGIQHKTKPWRSVQFHPEATPGPTDTVWIFDEFLEQIRSESGRASPEVSRKKNL